MRSSLALAGLLATLARAAEPPPVDTGPDKLDTSGMPAEMQERYALFAQKCSKCHSLARPLNARLKGDEWKNYLKKMIRRPGSGINEDAARRIFEFLKFYTERRTIELGGP